MSVVAALQTRPGGAHGAEPLERREARLVVRPSANAARGTTRLSRPAMAMAMAGAASQGKGACRRPGPPTCDPVCPAHALIFNDKNQRFRDAAEADQEVRDLGPGVCVCCGGEAKGGLAIRIDHYAWALEHKHWRFCERECVDAVTRVLEGGEYPNRNQNCLTYIEAQEHARRRRVGAGTGAGAGADEAGVVNCVKCNARCRERTFDQNGKRKTNAISGLEDYELVSHRSAAPPLRPPSSTHHLPPHSPSSRSPTTPLTIRPRTT